MKKGKNRAALRGASNPRGKKPASKGEKLKSRWKKAVTAGTIPKVANTMELVGALLGDKF